MTPGQTVYWRRETISGVQRESAISAAAINDKENLSYSFNFPFEFFLPPFELCFEVRPPSLEVRPLLPFAEVGLGFFLLVLIDLTGWSSGSRSLRSLMASSAPVVVTAGRAGATMGMAGGAMGTAGGAMGTGECSTDGSWRSLGEVKYDRIRGGPWQE